MVLICDLGIYRAISLTWCPQRTPRFLPRPVTAVLFVTCGVAAVTGVVIWLVILFVVMLNEIPARAARLTGPIGL